MKASLSCLGALLAVGAAASGVQAQYMFFGGGQSPDACGPGHYCTNWCGTPHGPSYCVRPPWEPFNGILPGPREPGFPGYGPQPGFREPGFPGYGPQPGFPTHPGYKPGRQVLTPVFPTHPYARSPRDYFMVE